MAAVVLCAALAVGCTAGTTATPERPAAEPGAPVGSSTCLDGRGDATVPPADLTRTSLAVDGDRLVVTWEAAPPAGRDRSYYAQLGASYQLGVRKIDRGAYVETAGFVFDLDTSTQVDVPATPTGDDRAELHIPLAELSKLELPVDWTATLTDNTVDLDTCTATWMGPAA